jgi:hypothetical protein
MSSILADQYCPRIQHEREEGGVAGSQPMSTAVHRSPNKLRRSNSIFKLSSGDLSLQSKIEGSDFKKVYPVLVCHGFCRQVGLSDNL